MCCHLLVSLRHSHHQKDIQHPIMQPSRRKHNHIPPRKSDTKNRIHPRMPPSGTCLNPILPKRHCWTAIKYIIEQ